MCIYKDK